MSSKHKDKIIDLRKVSETKEHHTQSVGKIEWETEEFEYREKDSQWFLIGIIITIGLFISLLILKNVFGAATILLLAFIIYIYSTKEPEKISVKVDSRGVQINQKVIPYSNIDYFWIIYEPPVKDLIIVKKDRFTPKMIIPIGNIDPVQLRGLLIDNSIKEKEVEESMAEIISRRVGF